MAAFNSRSHLLQTQKPFSVLLLTSIAFFLLLLNQVNSSNDIFSFYFDKFEPNQQDIIFQGDAKVSKGEIQLTKEETLKSVGRVLFAEPVRIWDATSDRIASFYTYFSFAAKAPTEIATADGFAFFIAPEDSVIPPNSTGGLLGLFSDSKYDASRRTVAVEFDTFSNKRWDPVGRHIGIDVNSIKSIKTVPWGWRSAVADVYVYYDALIKTLTAYLVYPETGDTYIISEILDLKGKVPEWVRIGITAANSKNTFPLETHHLRAWAFARTFETGSSIIGRAKENDVLRLARFV